MNRAFFPTPESPLFCSLHAKTSAALLPFCSVCRLRGGDAVPRLSSWCRIHSNDASWCFIARLALALADGWAGSHTWLAYLVWFPPQPAAQKAGGWTPKSPHTHKYVIIEILDCVWGKFCWFVSQNIYFACLCVRFQKWFGWMHFFVCVFVCVDFLFQELFFLSINNNKEDSQGPQCRWSARMILSFCVNRFPSLVK